MSKPAPDAQPQAPVPVPAVDDERDAIVKSLRHDVEALHLDLDRTLQGLKDLRDAIAEMGQETSDSVAGLRRDLQVVAEALAEQQAALDRTTDTKAAALGARSSYERLLEERRARMGAAVIESIDAPARRGLLPRIQRTLHPAPLDAAPEAVDDTA